MLDTGAEQTVVSRELARRAASSPITYTESAGVGDVGFRGLQIGRIDTLEVGTMKVRNVPTLIKNPPLGGMPGREPESFSPLALGLSMRVDYASRQLTMSAPPAGGDLHAPSCRSRSTGSQRSAARSTVHGQRRSSSTPAGK